MSDIAVAPVDMRDLDEGVTSVSVSNGFACAVRMNESATCWGANEFGQLGGHRENGDAVCPQPLLMWRISLQVSQGLR